MKKVSTTKQLSEREILPIVAFCQQHRGGMARIVELFNKGLTKPLQRPAIARWLFKDAAKRGEPLHGAGLRLTHAYEQARKEFRRK